MKFDVAFWLGKLEELNYPLKRLALHIDTLREQRVFPKDASPVSVMKVTDESYVEVDR